MATLSAEQVRDLDLARAISRPAYLRKMAWLMPRMSRAVPYLGYVLVSARKPDASVAEAP
jgi:hypothetical protein